MVEESLIDVYRALQRTLDKLPVGYPETESGVEIRILKELFTPIQAMIGSKLEFQLKHLDDIYDELKNSDLTQEKLEENLDEMYDLGLILRTTKPINGKEGKKYAATAFMLGFYEFHAKKMTSEYIRDVDQYLEEGFTEELNKTKTPQLRTIPIGDVVEAENQISSYDNVRQIFENCGEPIVLNECICRKKNEMSDRKCTQTELLEACFSFRSAGKAYLKRGLGRIIQKEEALKILEQAEKDGLVLQSGNSQRPMALCLCCGCCCNLLVNQKRIGATSDYFASNYFATVDSELCTGCGICETRCQMDAIEIVEGVSNIDRNYCIGCGVCAPTCPEEAITLKKKDEKELTIPPKNTFEFYQELAKKKAELEK